MSFIPTERIWPTSGKPCNMSATSIWKHLYTDERTHAEGNNKHAPYCKTLFRNFSAAGTNILRTRTAQA